MKMSSDEGKKMIPITQHGNLGHGKKSWSYANGAPERRSEYPDKSAFLTVVLVC